jgi:multiple sugar transport system permease protein
VIVGVRSRGAKIRSAIFGYANLVPYIFFALFPFYFMIITSLKSDNELYNLKAVPFLIQTGVITDHYRYLFFKTEFLTWMMNSLIISITATGDLAGDRDPRRL